MRRARLARPTEIGWPCRDMAGRTRLDRPGRYPSSAVVDGTRCRRHETRRRSAGSDVPQPCGRRHSARLRRKIVMAGHATDRRVERDRSASAAAALAIAATRRAIDRQPTSACGCGGDARAQQARRRRAATGSQRQQGAPAAAAAPARGSERAVGSTAPCAATDSSIWLVTRGTARRACSSSICAGVVVARRRQHVRVSPARTSSSSMAAVASASRQRVGPVAASSRST